MADNNIKIKEDVKGLVPVGTTGRNEVSSPMKVMAEKTSGVYNRRMRWLKYIEDKKKAKAEEKPLPPCPPSGRAGAKHKTKPMVVASTHQAEPSSTGPGENEELVPEERKKKQRSVSDPSIKPASKKNMQGPRPAGSGGPSYSAISANLLRVLDTFGESISKRMEITTFDRLKGAVMDKIVDIPANGFVPRFRDTFVMEGVATFICNDGESFSPR